MNNRIAQFADKPLRLFIGLSMVSAILSAQAQIDIDPNQDKNTLIVNQTPNTDLQKQRQKLEQMESQFDAYHVEIGESSLQLASMLATEGYFKDAMQPIRRALHISRINHGLDSERQLPILELMHQTQAELNQIEDASHTLNRILHVYQQNYSENTAEIERQQRKIGAWHLSLYFSRERRNINDLVNAHRALDNAYQIYLATDNRPYDFELYGLLSTLNYELALTAKEINQTAQDIESFSIINQGVARLIIGAYRRGTAILENGLNQTLETGDNESMARAMLLYADWNQLFRKLRKARKYYIDAFHITSELEDQHPLKGAFDQPHKLPKFGVSLNSLSLEDKQIEIVELQHDVSAWGLSSNIDALVNTDTENSHKAARRAAIRIIRTSLYRPAIVDALPVESKAVKQYLAIEI